MKEVMRQSKRIGIAVVGAVVLVVGIIAIPYPGPGWLIVFMGLAILATEFTWAQRVLDYARERYDAWGRWLQRQHGVIRLLVLVATGVVVIGTMWLLNVFGMVDHFLGLHQAWLRSPFGL